MILRKKNMVQKSFRIDQRLEFDLALLAELTNKSQNDLVNFALEEFLLNNAKWFIDNAIVEHYSPIFEYTGEDYEPRFKMDGVVVELNDEDGFYKVHYVVTKENEIVEDYEKNISISTDEAEENLKHCLRYIASYIDIRSEDAKQYLKERLDYKDFTPTIK